MRRAWPPPSVAPACRSSSSTWHLRPTAAIVLAPLGRTVSEPFAAADFADIVAELDAQPTDIRITKHQWGAFYGTDLDLQLRRRGIAGIVLTGISTSIGVDSTARGANERAYNITFASDAMTDANADSHRHSLERIFPRIGQVRTTAEILGAVASLTSS